MQILTKTNGWGLKTGSTATEIEQLTGLRFENSIYEANPLYYREDNAQPSETVDITGWTLSDNSYKKLLIDNVLTDPNERIMHPGESVVIKDVSQY